MTRLAVGFLEVAFLALAGLAMTMAAAEASIASQSYDAVELTYDAASDNAFATASASSSSGARVKHLTGMNVRTNRALSVHLAGRGSLVAPSTAHASDLIEAPLWTSTKKGTSADNALRHFNDHGADFPDVQNALEYTAKAQHFLQSPPGGTLTRVRPNGDVVRFHPASDTFGVMDAAGAPRTFFVPDPNVHGYATNLDYFYAQ